MPHYSYVGVYMIHPDGLVEDLGITMSIDPDVVPSQYALHANYPNPFNPSTTIRFSVETHGNASLQIYDTAGRMVETLVNDRFEGGEYEVEWNASLHPSGLYFARLLADGMSFTAKLLLLK